MELKEAFELVVSTINEKFKEGVYDITTASEVLNAVNIVGRALMATKQIDKDQPDPSSEVSETPKKSSKK